MMDASALSQVRSAAALKAAATKRRQLMEKMPELMEQLFEMLSVAADGGLPCPSLHEMTTFLGVAEWRVSAAMTALEDEGRIRRHGPRNQGRRYEIVPTGRITAPIKSSPRRLMAGAVPKGEKLPEEVKRAKLFIQRRGYPVFRAKTVNPKADPGLWVIGSFGPRFSDDDLMTFARKRGWQG